VQLHCLRLAAAGFGQGPCFVLQPSAALFAGFPAPLQYPVFAPPPVAPVAAASGLTPQPALRQFWMLPGSGLLRKGWG